MPDHATLSHRLEWLLAHGVKTIHFCGGEPTIHPALPDLLKQVHASGGKSRITTNAIEISEATIAALRAASIHTKVSLHGDRAHHNKMVGCEAFDRTVGNLHRLIACRVPTSIQTTVVADGMWVVDWMIDFCLENGILRLSILPFLPRGRGFQRRETYGLSSSQLSNLTNHVKKKRRELCPRLDLRWLNLTAHRLHVVEVDGRIVLEGTTDASDVEIGRIHPMTHTTTCCR
jgi:MoaA/NifB/PqqE/SkfB family radical SAM enzyme